MLNRWFNEVRRDFPWRLNPSPYRVWVSEVMLQQTQALRVVDYFERWMNRFPDIDALADAPLSDVLKLWEGLGYYSRARALHKGAKILQEHFHSRIPSDREALSHIPGLGPYTISAILAFAFQEHGAAVDGNVMRVTARYFALDDDISKTKTRQKFQPLADSLLDPEEPWVSAEALIELGATLCTPKNPRCEACPLQKGCKAAATGQTHTLPINSKKIEYTQLTREVAVILSQDHLLLQCGTTGKIMQDLHEFPYIECPQEGLTESEAEEQFQDMLQQKITFVEKLATTKQSFTRYRATLYPKIYKIKERKPIEGYAWYTWDEAKNMPFSSGHKRIFIQAATR